MNTELLLVLHAASTWAMVGLIWFVQVVHYALYPRVGAAGFAAYETQHTRRTSWVVGPLMACEAVTALGLAVLVGGGMAWAGLALLGVVWASTALLQVPCHARLERGFDLPTARRLVRTNWVRTAAWTLRGAIAAALVWERLGAAPPA